MAKASSTTGSFILLCFIVSCFIVNQKVPGAEALVFFPCKSDEDCKFIRCRKISAHCSKGQCSCRVISAADTVSASAYRKTTADCKKD
ncbi:hypothetical protein Patl1_16611 [Pistacia atlantica]|uniref:Uncharacterized protein n=1 Tax=Pistacia atlantica TaxID=434234 RepID=A0ACC1B8Q6_9ROSI|nr:hypothetical protein Patl1_16611 [Pistacia atlantica]